MFQRTYAPSVVTVARDGRGKTTNARRPLCTRPLRRHRPQRRRWQRHLTFLLEKVFVMIPLESAHTKVRATMNGAHLISVSTGARLLATTKEILWMMDRGATVGKRSASE